MDETELPAPPPRVPRSRGLLYLCMAFFGLGVYLQISFYLVLAGSVLALLVLSHLYARRTLAQSRCARKVYHGAFEGEDVRVNVEVSNHGALPVFLPEIGDTFTPDKHTSKEVLAPVRLDHGKVCRRTYFAICFRRRGVYKLGPMRVRTSDPLGMFDMEKEVAAPADYYIYPGTFPIPRFPLIGQKAVFTTGYDMIPRQGQSQTYMGTREYRPGDEIRTVDWRATARFGRVIVKEFETDVDAEVTLFLDLDATHAQGVGQRSTLETGVKIAASLAMTCIAARAYVQFVALGSRYHYVPFGSGETHLIRLLDLLVHVKQDGAGSFGDFLAFTRDLVRPGSTVFLIFTSIQIDEGKMAPVFASYRARNARLYAVVLDDAAFFQWKAKLDLDAALEVRNRTVRFLEGEGFTVVPVDAEQPLEEQFAQAAVEADPVTQTGAELARKIGAHRETVA